MCTSQRKSSHSQGECGVGGVGVEWVCGVYYEDHLIHLSIPPVWWVLEDWYLLEY